MTSPPPPEAPVSGEYRPGGVRVLAVGWWLLTAFLLADLLLRGSVSSPVAALGVTVLMLGSAVVHALFWQPLVRVDADAAELVNVLRMVRLPWAAVTDLDTRWALTVEAGGRRYTSWAAPASGRRIRPVSRRETPWAEPGAEGIAGSRAPGSSAGEAAVMLTNAWQAWRDRPASRGAGTVPDHPDHADHADHPDHPDHPGTEVTEVTVRWNVPVLLSLGGTVTLVLLAAGWAAAG